MKDLVVCSCLVIFSWFLRFEYNLVRKTGIKYLKLQIHVTYGKINKRKLIWLILKHKKLVKTENFENSESCLQLPVDEKVCIIIWKD